MTNTLQIPQGNGTQLHLSTPVPDTQNETARKQTKEDRGALMDRLRQLLVDLQTGRFDPLKVASEETCKAISKFFPACFAHPDEQDAAFELLRNLMTASTNRLRECYVSTNTRSDDVSRPIWLYADDKRVEGEALQTVFTNTLWAILAYLDSLPGEETQGGNSRKSAKEATARAFFPLLFKLLSSSDVARLNPQSIRDALAIIQDCVEESDEVKKILDRSGRSALANVLAFVKDHPAWSIAYNIAGSLLSDSEDQNQKVAEALFPLKAYKGQYVEKARSRWAKLACDKAAIKKSAPVLSAWLAKVDSKQPQPFYTINPQIRVLNYKVSLDASKQTNYRDYVIALNERSLSCLIIVDERAEVLDIRLDTVLSLEMDKEGSITIMTSTIPTITTEIFKKGRIPAGGIETILHLKLSDAERLQDMLKHRYMPNFNRKPLTKPGKVSLSQGQVRAGEDASPSSDDGTEKRDARVVELMKNVESASPPDNGSDHDYQVLDHQDLFEDAPLPPPPPPHAHGSTDKAKSTSIANKPRSGQEKDNDHGNANTTAMSLDNSMEDDLPNAYASAKDHAKVKEKSTSADQKSLTKPASKRNTTFTVEIPPKKPSPPSTTAKPTTEPSAVKPLPRKVQLKQATDSELSAVSSSSDDDDDDEEDNYAPPTTKTAKPVRKDLDVVKPAKKKARDSGFGDRPPAQKNTAKRKAPHASDNEGTDYEDLAKAGIEEKKLKVATPKRGRPSARGKGTARGTGRGKAAPASTAKPRSRKEESVEYVPPDKEQKEVPQSEGRVTRSTRAAAKNTVQPKPKAKKIADVDASDEDELPARPAKRKKADKEAEKAAADALDEFYETSKSTTKVAGMKSRKVITSFSQLVDKNRNPLASSHRRAPPRVESQPASPSFKSDIKQDSAGQSTSRKLRRRTRSPSNVGNAMLSSPKAIGDAFDELLQESPPADQKRQREQSSAYEQLGTQNQIDTNDDHLRNYTTLYDENVVNETTDCGDNDFFANDNMNGHHSEPRELHGKREVDQSVSTEVKFQQDVAPAALPKRVDESLKGARELSRGARQSSNFTQADMPNAIIGKGEDTSMDIDDVVAESIKEKSRLSAAGVIIEESHHTEKRVQTSVVVQKRPASERAVSEELPEMLITRHAEKNEQAQVRRVKTTLPVPAKDASKRLKQAFEATQTIEHTEHEESRSARSSRRTRADDQDAETTSSRVTGSTKAPNKSLSPVKTSTPSRGYDEEESQTQMFEDPMHAFEAQQAETRRVAEAEGMARAQATRSAEAKKLADAQKVAEDEKKAEAEAKRKAKEKQVADTKTIDENRKAAQAKRKARAEQLEIAEANRLAEAEALADEQKRLKLAAARQAKEEREMAQHRAKQNVQQKGEDEPDKLVDLSVKLAMLLVQNHRKSLNTYKASKNVGIDNIINIVATGCSEAEQLDSTLLHNLQDHSAVVHKAHADSALPLEKIVERVQSEKVKVRQETSRLNANKEISKVKLAPDLFSKFKSLKSP